MKFICSAILAVVWLYIGAAYLDAPYQHPIDTQFAKHEYLLEATNPELEDSTRSFAAQKYCGNAGWELSENGKNLKCIPRRGKPYWAR